MTALLSNDDDDDDDTWDTFAPASDRKKFWSRVSHNEVSFSVSKSLSQREEKFWKLLSLCFQEEEATTSPFIPLFLNFFSQWTFLKINMKLNPKISFKNNKVAINIFTSITSPKCHFNSISMSLHVD